MHIVFTQLHGADDEMSQTYRPTLLNVGRIQGTSGPECMQGYPRMGQDTMPLVITKVVPAR